MDNSGKCPLKALLCPHTPLFPLLADYVSRGDLLVGGVGEGKVEGKVKEDGKEEGGGNANWNGWGGDVPRGSPGLPRPSSL